MTSAAPQSVMPQPAAGARPTGSLSRKILGGVSVLGAATVIERGLSFLANILAARMAGASTFGAYSLALTTANNIASYAGAGIGSTATRFSGEHASRPGAKAILQRALLLVSLSSAALAPVLLFGGAAPLANLLLRNPGLTGLLRWAALPAAFIILLECFRGYLIGQRRFHAQVLLSATAGLGYLVGVPWASRFGPSAMVCAFAAATAVALLVALVGEKRGERGASIDEFPRAAEKRGAPKVSPIHPPSVTGLARQVWNFGLVQLLGVVGLNAAGFWIASLVVRSDSSLVEMGLFAVSSQVRNMASLAPALFTQTSFGLLADSRHEPDQVMGASTFAAAFICILLAGSGMALLPWALPLAYGPSFSRAVFPACVALAISIVHLSNGPAAARLTIVSLRSTTAINTAWAVLVFGLGTLLLSRSILPATAAMLTYLAAHLMSAAAVGWVLRSRGFLRHGLVSFFFVPSGGAILLLALSYARSAASSPAAQAGFTVLLLLVTVALALLVLREGARQGFLPRSLGSFRFRQEEVA